MNGIFEYRPVCRDGFPLILLCTTVVEEISLLRGAFSRQDSWAFVFLFCLHLLTQKRVIFLKTLLSWRVFFCPFSALLAKLQNTPRHTVGKTNSKKLNKNFLGGGNSMKKIVRFCEACKKLLSQNCFEFEKNLMILTFLAHCGSEIRNRNESRRNSRKRSWESAQIEIAGDGFMYFKMVLKDKRGDFFFLFSYCANLLEKNSCWKLVFLPHAGVKNALLFMIRLGVSHPVPFKKVHNELRKLKKRI